MARRQYPFWLRAVAAHPDEVYGGRHWTFWQYTSTGLIPGIAGEVDINVFDGSASDWAAWLASNRHPESKRHRTCAWCLFHLPDLSRRCGYARSSGQTGCPRPPSRPKFPVHPHLQLVPTVGQIGAHIAHADLLAKCTE